MEPTLEELKNLAQTQSVDELTQIVAEKITSTGYYKISMWENFTAPRLYHARKHNHLEGNVTDDNQLQLFEYESEFWNPPIKGCRMGRCNDVDESLLYCSTSWKAAISEVRPSAGDFISVSVYDAKKHPNNPDEFLGLRIIPIGIKYLSQIVRFKHMLEDYDFEGREAALYEMDTFLDNLFYIDVTNQTNHLYKLSVAVTKCMMKNLFDGQIERQMHGMIYSSMMRNKTDYNIVLRPVHARTIYKLYQVQTFEVLEITETKIKLKLVRDGMTVGTKNHPLDFFKMTWFKVNNGADDEIEKIRE